MRAILPALLAALIAACGPTPEPQPPSPPPPPSAPPPTLSASAAPPPAAFKPMLARVPVGEQDPRWGSDQAPVTVVMFGNPDNQVSGKVLEKLEKVQASLGEGKLRVVWKSYAPPAMPHAVKLAQVTQGLMQTDGSAVAHRFLQLAFQHPFEMHNIERVMAVVQESGVKDFKAFERRLIADEFLPKVNDDSSLVSRLGVEQAPVLFVNGYRLSGRVKESALREVVNDELAKMEELLKGGKEPGEAYALRTQQNANNEQKFAYGMPQVEVGKYYRVVLGSSPALGSPKALVTLVMFGGYQDPFSRRAQETLLKLRKAYKNDLRIVWKNTPLDFHRVAVPLAALALEARTQNDAAFWKAHDRLMSKPFWDKHQKEFLDSEMKLTVFETIGRELGLKRNGAEVSTDPKSIDAVRADKPQNEALHVQATPTFFINGQAISGAQPEEKFRAVIDQELARARALVKAGTKPEQVYEALMADIKEVEELTLSAPGARRPGSRRRPAWPARRSAHTRRTPRCPTTARAKTLLRAASP